MMRASDGRLSLIPRGVIAAPASDSHVFLASRIDITASVVIIDLAAMDGMPVAQAADYAAMRALARTRPATRDSAASTILSLFDPKAGTHGR
jgi:hypothetical protein